MSTEKYGNIKLAVVPGRAEPSDKSEMVTELLFGEAYEVLEEQQKWILVRSIHDDYICWIDRKQHQECAAPTSKVLRLPYLYNKVPDSSGNDLVLPMASCVSEDSFFEPLLSEQNQSQADGHFGTLIEQISRRYLNTPYRWGGRTPLGIDCSGFVQNVFLLCGIKLPRDAQDQAEKGETIAFVDEAETGDLVYFDNAEGKIIHVGIALKSTDRLRIIHASGKVRIDALDHEGIFHSDLNTYTHRLRVIKRVR